MASPHLGRRWPSLGAVTAVAILLHVTSLHGHFSDYSSGSPMLRGLATADVAGTYTVSAPALGLDDLPQRVAGAYTAAERMNRIHLRDIPTIEVLDTLVPQLKAALPAGETVTLLSGQQGMVSYTLARRHYSDLDILDRFGLVDARIMECLDHDVVARSPYGMSVDVDEVRGLLNSLDRCGIDPPEVIADLAHSLRERSLTEEGYTIVYLQEGRLYGPRPSHPISALAFVAVRDDLLPAIGFTSRVVAAVQP